MDKNGKPKKAKQPPKPAPQSDLKSKQPDQRQAAPKK